AEYAHDARYLLSTAHHRVELAVAGRLGEVASDLIQGRSPTLRGLLSTRTTEATATETATARTEAPTSRTAGHGARSHLAAAVSVAVASVVRVDSRPR